MIKEKKVRDFLLHVDTYLKGDLETFKRVCINCEQTSRNGLHGTSGGGKYDPTKMPDCFRMTIPMANTLFSTIDIVGFLLGSKNIGESGLIEENFSKFFKSEISKEELKLLVYVYRHGMIHGFFPLLDVFISYHSSQEEKGLFYLFEDEKLILNVNRLIALVLDKFSKIKNGNSSLYQNMEEQYKKYLEKGENKEEDFNLIKTIVNRLKK